MIPSNGWRITPPEMRLTDSSSGSSPRAVQQLVERLLGELLDGRFQRKAVLFAECVVVHRRDAARVGVPPAGGADSALLDRKVAVRNDAVGIDTLLNAQTSAHRARTVRVVE